MNTSTNQVRSEDVPPYVAIQWPDLSPAAPDDQVARTAEDRTIARAVEILASRLRKPGVALSNPDTVRTFLRLQLAGLEHECFTVLFLDAHHSVIECEHMFRGTLTATSVYPREVVKRALALNAAAVILAHNHPSGVAEPSRADEHITQLLRQALALVDVRVIDHFVIGASDHTVSFAERGLL